MAQTKKEQLRCGIDGCDYTTDRPASLGAHKHRVHTVGKKAAPVKPAPKPSRHLVGVAKVHRDVKPENVPPPVAIADDAQVLDTIIALAELPPATRSRVLAYATKRWPS